MKKLFGYQVVLKPVEQADLEMMRNWRNDPEISSLMLSQSHISKEDQQRWFEGICNAEDQGHWVINYKNIPIGVANIRAVQAGVPLPQAKAIEPGLYIADNRYKGNILAFAPSLLLADYCFEELGAEQLQARVKPENQGAIRYNQQLGYDNSTTGKLVEMILTKPAYQQATRKIKTLLSRVPRP